MALWYTFPLLLPQYLFCLSSFTITGGPARYADRGIIPRSITALFSEFQRRTEVSFSCFVSYLEIYNDNGYDLLCDRHSQSTQLENMRKVSMLEDEEGLFHFRNLSTHPVTSEEEALNLLFLGDTNRAIGETAMNLASSRSHCIFILGLDARKAGSDFVTRSKLNLVDLAGSERVHKTNSSGQILNEAKAINSSLFYLEMVIVALQERDTNRRERNHIPYRNSMMTSVLRDSLGGNCT
jgi:kinesin family protein 6/9